MGTLVHDFRFAVRLLRKTPLFTAVAVLTLALAIAANTVIFTGVNAVLLQPLPYAQPDRLVRVYSQFPRQDLLKFALSPPEYLDVARETRTMSSVAGWFSATTNLTGGDRPLAVSEAFVTASFFEALGVEPVLGRGFTPEEDRPNGPNVVVISYDLWQQSFRGSADVLGKAVPIDGVATTILGVLPKGFDFPRAGTQLWGPLQLDPSAVGNRASHGTNVVGRMKPGVTVDAANADLKDLATAWSAAHPSSAEHYPDPVKHPIVARSLKGEIVDSARPLLLMMQGVVFFVLLIACVNISNLLVARADARRGEVAVRSALGAGRWRLARQFLIESLVLGLCGALVGLLVTPWALDGMLGLLPAGTPRAAEIRIDGAVLAFAVASAIAASLVFGLAPLFHTRAGELRSALGAAANRATGSGRSARVRQALIVAEIALATVLVVGAGLFTRSFFALEHVDPGFDPHHLVTFQIVVDKTSVADDPKLIRFYAELRDHLAQIPAVDDVSAMNNPPPRRTMNNNDVFFPGRAPDPKGPIWSVDYWQIVVGDYVKTLGGRIVAGRGFLPSDDEHGARVLLVNEAFARKFWPGESAVGQRLRAVDPTDPDATVVGVVGDMKYAGLDQPTGTELVFPIPQTNLFSKYTASDSVPRRMTFLLRSHGDPRALFASVRSTMASVAPSIPIDRMQTMDDAVYADAAQPRFLTVLVLGFAAIAVVMAVIGVYGVMSYSVVQRTQEIGIRVALGAPAGRVLGMLLRHGALLAGAGIGVGLVLSFALERVLAHSLSSLLFGAIGLDGAMAGAVVALLGAAAVLACWIPAQRASRIHPSLAMRTEG